MGISWTNVMSLSTALWGPTSLAFAAVVTATLALLRWPVRSNKPAALRRRIPSPRQTLLPQLSAGQVAALSYPPDLLPGARDVETLYGVMRVYEWGPEDGMKVLLIHGDTTPGPMLGPIAVQLVERGCRVMIIGTLILDFRSATNVCLVGILRESTSEGTAIRRTLFSLCLHGFLPTRHLWHIRSIAGRRSDPAQICGAEDTQIRLSMCPMILDSSPCRYSLR